MTHLHDIAPVSELKAQARRLRERLRGSGVDLSHSQSLEIVAHQHGLRDWNTLVARAGNEVRLRIGGRVRGRYLGQPFTGEVKGLTSVGGGAQHRVTLHFDDPVDVVRFDSFSAYRQRVTGVVGPDGRSPHRTSDGAPQLIVEPE